MQTYQLFCGRDIPTGGTVTDSMWDSFTDIINDYFDGYTVSDVQGMWKGTPEATKCVSVCTDDYASVLKVADAYKKLFEQDSVAIQTLAPMTFV